MLGNFPIHESIFLQEEARKSFSTSLADGCKHVAWALPIQYHQDFDLEDRDMKKEILWNLL
jgi:hypothetical protein